MNEINTLYFLLGRKRAKQSPWQVRLAIFYEATVVSILY